MKAFLDLYPDDNRGPWSNTHTHGGNRFLTFEGTSAQFCTACALGHRPDHYQTPPRDPACPHEMASSILNDGCGFPGCNGPWTAYGTLRGVRVASCDEHASEAPLELS